MSDEYTVLFTDKNILTTIHLLYSLPRYDNFHHSRGYWSDISNYYSVNRATALFAKKSTKTNLSISLPQSGRETTAKMTNAGDILVGGGGGE